MPSSAAWFSFPSGRNLGHFSVAASELGLTFLILYATVLSFHDAEHLFRRLLYLYIDIVTLQKKQGLSVLHGPPGNQVVPDVDRVSRVHGSKLYEPHVRTPDSVS